jgi:predicted NBD/HSP70 family sugar kinase
LSARHVGIDVGGSSVRVLAESDGRRSDVASAPVPGSYEDFLELVPALVAEVVDGAVSSVGCGLPGTSDGVHARFVPALPWVEGRAVRDDLAAVLGAPCLLALDGHLTLLAEATEGAARGCSAAILVAVGTGIGGAMMLGGRIWRGFRGSAGSWGWLPAEGAAVDPQHGQFELVASGSALSAELSPRSTHEIVSAARRGDAVALAEIERYALRLGRGIAALASVTDPEVVLVGGGLSSAMDVLGPLLEQSVREHASPDGRQVPVRAAELGPHAGVVGALLLAQRGEEAWL